MRSLLATALMLALAVPAAAGEPPTFDHAAFDRLLAACVDDNGRVDYRALSARSTELDGYLRALAAAPIERMTTDERLALWINAYNAATLRTVLDHYPIASIRDVPDAWSAQRFDVGGRVLSLDELEHREIRGKFREPRIHFALNCAAVGCPPLRPEAYVASKLDAQLEAQARRVHADTRWLALDGDTVRLTRLYDWYRTDFEAAAGSVLAYAARFAPSLAQRLAHGERLRVAWIEYDWALNDATK